MLTRLRQDHHNIGMLLGVLEDKAYKLKRNQKVNFSLISDIIEYMQQYTDRCHHPVEDTLYGHYCQQFGNQEDLERLTVEHERLAQANEMLSHSITMVLSDLMVPMPQLIEEIERYVTLQQAHLQYEEQHIFPQIEQKFVESDWRKVETELTPLFIQDPLFSEEGAAEFRALKQYINDETYAEVAP
ncbi:hemerythrin domain-containing protein [Paraferrimonas sedimenticola]|uniref:Hemerythrin n=1 Tax=Paraferrimonas sedimenticola TaxID=375674 RepID=A0AA37RXD3_9GAMM|nr:hemerythrin domain-containing protein [Paraferrimonas sedimenticola]GLP97159.1 hemerythrin [Paraferrimonas sedimenticola]